MSQKKRDRHLSRIRTKIAILWFVFLFIGVAAFYFITPIISRQIDIAQKGYDVEEIRQDFAKKDATTRNVDASTDARDALNSKDDERAKDIYEQAVAAESDPNRKVKLAVDQSLLLYGLHKYDQAEAVAKEAESYSDDKFYISDWLGRLYEGLSKYREAEKYYQRAANLAESPTNDTGFDKVYYEAKVQKMKSLAENQS